MQLNQFKLIVTSFNIQIPLQCLKQINFAIKSCNVAERNKFLDILIESHLLNHLVDILDNNRYNFRLFLVSFNLQNQYHTNIPMVLCNLIQKFHGEKVHTDNLFQSLIVTLLLYVSCCHTKYTRYLSNTRPILTKLNLI